MPGLLVDWLKRPARIERLVLLRVLAPLAILGFMSTRLVHADYWLSTRGFSVPDLGGTWQQPLYIAPVSPELAWGIAGVMVLSGLLTVVGYRTRLSASVFALSLIYVGLADRLSAFTVTKLGPMVALCICFSAASSRYSVDAWRRAQGAAAARELRPTHATSGSVRFLQLFLAVFYCVSGICKARGDWLSRSDVLWTHLHDSYQTGLSYFLAKTLPSFSWGAFQYATLLFELGAPLWFLWRRSRKVALVYGLGMHLMIGLMFGPVKWFSLLMMSLLLVAYAPDSWLVSASTRLKRAFSSAKDAKPALAE